MSQLTSHQALTIIDAAFKAARQENYKPMAVVVVDAAGQVVASAREDGTAALKLDIALGKTGASIGMGVNSRLLVQRAADMPVFFSAISASTQQKFIPQTGAVLIHDDEGNIIGAAGASGGTGDQDEEIVIAGIAAAGLKHA